MLRSHRRRTPSTIRLAARRAAVEAMESRQMLAVNIQFDYSLDSSGFFNDTSRRALLQQAADEVTGDMTDFLAPITPGGADTWSISFNNPSSGNQTTIDDPTIPADTIIVYVGAYDLPNTVIGLGGFAGYSAAGSQSFQNLVRSRGNPGALRNTPTDFAPFAGSMAFDNATDFYFGSNTNSLGSTQTDFVSVVEHELVHILGFPGARSFDRYVAGNNFNGPKAVAVFGGAVPLEPDENHFLDGTSVNGEEALMDPSYAAGTRQTITELDLAVLDDIGWDFDAPGPPDISITATDSGAAEPDSDGTFRITRSGSLAQTLDIDVTVTGTAIRGTDYDLALGSTNTGSSRFTFGLGVSSIDVTLDVRDDTIIEADETAIIQIADGANYSVDGAPATVTISDDDLRRLQEIRASAVVVNAGRINATSDLGATDIHLSADGRYATFLSNSTDLVASPLTTYIQAYRRDLVTGTTRLVSIADGDEAEANNDSLAVRVSANGRYVAFETNATDVVDDGVDRNVASDVYLKDMDTNETWLVSRNRAGAVGGELVAVSNDGEQVLFRSSTTGSAFVKGLQDQNAGDDLFVWSRRTGRYTCVTLNTSGTRTGNRSTTVSTASGDASFSGDGRFVVFASRASDLVIDVSDENTFQFDVFVRDLTGKKTEYVSISTDDDQSGNVGSGNAEITMDGRYVIFRSGATDLVPSITDNNRTQDVFVRDRVSGTTRLLSRKLGGTATGNGGVGLPDITADGRFAVFTSNASDMLAIDSNSTSDAYLYNLTNNSMELLTVNTAGNGGGNAGTTEVKISDDGTRAIFASFADNLPGDFDKRDSTFAAIYARDLVTDRNSVLSFDQSGNPSGADSYDIVVSADGTRAAFTSESSAIVGRDFNGRADLFISEIPNHEAAHVDENGKLIIYGSPVNDTISIQRLNSRITVRRNDQRFDYKTSAVTSIDVLAGDGDDVVTLGAALIGAYVSAGSGNDTVRGGGGRERVQGGPGRDLIYGGLGDDRIDGGKGNDAIYGEADDDNLFGGDGEDKVYGGGGRDRLRGDIGIDTLDAGGSNDRFYDADGFADLFLGGTGTDTAVRNDSGDILDSVENS